MKRCRWWWACLFVLSASTAWAARAPSTLDEPRPVFALLIGQPQATRELPRLSAVETDVAMMHRFFGTVQPRKVFVHLPRGQVRLDLAREGAVTADATWPDLKRSIEALADAIDEVGGPADVYVYYAGHGRKRRVRAFTQTDLFLRPTEPYSKPGYDGILSTKMLQRHVLGRLESDEVRVHLIVDACQSAYLLEARGMRRTHRLVKTPPTVEEAMIERFVADYRHVGAVLATSGSEVTYENVSTGGIFSLALRSAAIGPADIDFDGRVTYREMEAVLPYVLSGRAGAAVPMLLPPGAEPDETFIDFRGRRVASVTFTPAVATRYELRSPMLVPYAVLYPAAGHRAVVRLPEQADFVASSRPQDARDEAWFQFRAFDEPIAMLKKPFDGEANVRRGDDMPPALVMPEPMGTPSMVLREEPEWVWVPERYTTLGISGTSEVPVFGPSLDSHYTNLLLGGELNGMMGEGPEAFTWRVGYTRTKMTEPYELTAKGDAVTITHRSGHLVRAAAGYARVLLELPLLEISGGGFLGGGMLFEQRGTSADDLGGDFDMPMAELGGELTARVLFPDSVWGLRVDLRAAAQAMFDDENPYVDMTVGATFGIEYEFALR